MTQVSAPQLVVPDELTQIIEDAGLAQSRANPIYKAFGPLVHELRDLLAETAHIEVTAADQTAQIEAAGEAYKKASTLRKTVEKVRVAEKADALAYGQVVDLSAKWIRSRLDPEEARLLNAREFAVVAEKKRKATLAETRRRELLPFMPDQTGLDLGELSDAAYAGVLAGAKQAQADKIAADAKAEADRLEAERIRRENEAKLKAENERLRLEAEAREKEAKAERERLEAEKKAIQDKADADRKAAEAKAAKEREAADLALRKESEARLELERQAKAKADAEAAQKKADEAAARKAARAPDKVKLQKFAAQVLALDIPTVSTTEAVAVRQDIAAKLASFAKWIDVQAATLD